MYNFFKTLFGVPPNDFRDHRTDCDLCDNPRDESSIINDDMDNSDFIRNFGPSMDRFGFTIFTDPIAMERYMDGLLEEMHKKMDVFTSFSNQPSITWEGDRNNISDNFIQPQSSGGSLRDSFLKSGHSLSAKKDVDLDGKVNVKDVENFLNNKPGISHDLNPVVQSPQNIYAKSVYIRTIKHPDGSVETIKKVRDHTGNEETIITKDNVGDSPIAPVTPNNPSMLLDDTQGLSVFKKFFPFG